MSEDQHKFPDDDSRLNNLFKLHAFNYEEIKANGKFTLNSHAFYMVSTSAIKSEGSDSTFLNFLFTIQHSPRDAINPIIQIYANLSKGISPERATVLTENKYDIWDGPLPAKEQIIQNLQQQLKAQQVHKAIEDTEIQQLKENRGQRLRK